MELLRQNVRLRYKVKSFSSKALLHLDIVVTESVFARYLIALREVVDSLELVQTLIKIALAGASCPEEIPFMRLSECEAIDFE